MSWNIFERLKSARLLPVYYIFAMKKVKLRLNHYLWVNMQKQPI